VCDVHPPMTLTAIARQTFSSGSFSPEGFPAIAFRCTYFERGPPNGAMTFRRQRTQRRNSMREVVMHRPRESGFGACKFLMQGCLR
jgi:hypothetical protein